jgi:hypothetical protein
MDGVLIKKFCPFLHNSETFGNGLVGKVSKRDGSFY